MHFLLALTLLALGGAAPAPAGLEVQTSSGRVQGFIDPALPHVRQWARVPFAQPPLGALRFAPPQAIAPPRAPLIDARAPPPSCMAWFSALPTMQNTLVPQFAPASAMSEDCLYLSVHAPVVARAGAHGPLPVVLFVHGGEWIWGDAGTPYYRPQHWVERTGDVIFVFLNFRLNVFGFPHARGLAPGETNVGYADIRLATEWVRDNIAAFGGDPERMIYWGDASGAASIDMFQFGRYGQDPIVKGMIASSADALFAADAGHDATHGNFTYLASQMGCSTATPADELQCMRTVDAGRIEHFLQNHTDSAATPVVGFVPYADNQTVFTVAQYQAMGMAGNYSKLPTVYGGTREEVAQLVPLPPGGPAPNETYIRAQTIHEFNCPQKQTLEYRKQSGATTYRYFYAGNFSNISPRPWMGAYHFSEMPLVMGSHALFRGNSTPFEYQVSAKMQELWRAFAMDPQRGLATAGWPEQTTSGQALAIAVADVGEASTGPVVADTITSVPGDQSCP